MKKEDAVAEAKQCANQYGGTWYVLRRKDDYKVSAHEQRGWKIAEMIGPGNQHNY